MTENKSGIHPLGKMVLVKLLKAKEKSKAGLFIPKSSIDDETREQVEGEVIEVGNGLIDEGKKHVFSVKVGDLVLLGRFQGHKIKRNDEEYNVVNEGDIIAIVDPL
jgi:chaperonin GroES